MVNERDLVRTAIVILQLALKDDDAIEARKAVNLDVPGGFAVQHTEPSVPVSVLRGILDTMEALPQITCTGWNEIGTEAIVRIHALQDKIKSAIANAEKVAK